MGLTGFEPIHSFGGFCFFLVKTTSAFKTVAKAFAWLLQKALPSKKNFFLGLELFGSDPFEIPKDFD